MTSRHAFPRGARLHPQWLVALPGDVVRPAYDRAALQGGIVHLGVGAFQRAHLGAVNEAALHATADMRWGITGVSLRSPEVRDALAPQDGLYALALRGAGVRGAMRQTVQVIGCLRGVLVAPESPAVVLELIADAATRIVSLTITEKGYCHDPATGAPRWEHPDVVHDLAQPAAPRGALGLLACGLRLRRQRGLPPVTLLSLDNLPANGRLLRGLVLAFAERLEPGLASWIAERCAFPCSMVDRIVPRTTDAERAAVRAALGLRDAWPVVGEHFLEWVVEDDFAAGRPAWDLGGARFVRDAQPFETLKLRMVNGVHSALAYLGIAAGWATVDAALARPALRAYLERLMRDEIEPALPALPGVDLAAYRARLLERFANPALAHSTQQIAMDGSQKLPQRLLGSMRERLARGAPVPCLALAVAAWLHYLRGHDEAGSAYALQDPLAEDLRALQVRAAQAAAGAARQGLAATRVWVEVMAGFTPVFGHDLGRQARFIEPVVQALHRLRRDGVAATLAAQT